MLFQLIGQKIHKGKSILDLVSSRACDLFQDAATEILPSKRGHKVFKFDLLLRLKSQNTNPQ